MRYKLIGLLPLLVVIGCGGEGVSVAPKAVSTLAGSATAGSLDGVGTAAQFSNPVNVVVAANGIAYVADFDNDLIRKIAPNGAVTTLTKQALFQRPFGMALSTTGKLYVSTDDNDSGNHSSGTGTVWSIDTSSGAATVVARDLGRPRGLAVLPNGQIVLSDLAQSTISLLDPTTGSVTFVAGQKGNPGYVDGVGTGAQFNRPYGVTVQSDGTLLVADQNNNRIRKVTLGGVVTTFAGTGVAGAANGPLSSATLNGPQDVKVDANGNVYIADTTGKRIRKVTGGTMHPVAGDGIAGFKDGPSNLAEFFGLEAFFVTPGGTIYVADGNGGDGSQPYNRIRVVR